MKHLLSVLFAGLALAQSPHAVTLAWSPGAGGGAPLTYTVLRGTVSGGPYAQIASVPATQTNYVDTSATGNVLAEGQKYCYVTQAVNAAGASGNSAEACATIPLSVPQPPTGLSAVAK